MRLMFQWASEDVNTYQIAKRLNELNIRTKKGCNWHPLAVGRVLRNCAYTGVQYYGVNRYRKVSNKKRTVTPRPESEVIRIEGFSPSIISQELFEVVRDRLKVRQCQATKSDRKYMMTGFSKCLKCGAPVVGASLQKGRYRYYRCRATVPTSTRPATCDALYIPADEFEDVAWRTLAEAIRYPAVMVAELQDLFATGGGDIGEEIASLKRERLNLKGQQRRLLELFQKAYIDEDLLEAQIGPLKALSDEKERAPRVLEEQLRHKDYTAEMERRIVEQCEWLCRKLENLDFEGRRSLFDAFGMKVDATREDISITPGGGPQFYLPLNEHWHVSPIGVIRSS